MVPGARGYTARAESGAGAAPAFVEVTFLREAGGPIVRTYTVPGAGRYTIDVSTIEELRNSSFGAAIRVPAGDVRTVVERSMYWNANGIFWSGGTNATGIPAEPPR